MSAGKILLDADSYAIDAHAVDTLGLRIAQRVECVFANLNACDVTLPACRNGVATRVETDSPGKRSKADLGLDGNVSDEAIQLSRCDAQTQMLGGEANLHENPTSFDG
jgi:hypothetical protein